MINTYKYIAINKKGKRVKGTFEAPTKKMMINYLSNKGITVISITKNNKKSRNFLNKDLGKSFNKMELLFFLKQLKSMLKAGVRVVDAVEILAVQTVNNKKRKIIYSLYFDLLTGISLSDAMFKYPKDFPEITVFMIQNGELASDLLNTLENIILGLERNEKIKKDIFNALKTPVIYVIMAIVVSIIIINVVLPQYIKLFDTIGGELPMPTLVLYGIYIFINKYKILIIIVSITLAVSFYLTYKNKKGYEFISFMTLKMPVIGEIVKLYNQSLVVSTLSQLTSSYVQLLPALIATKEVIKNSVYINLVEDSINNLKMGKKFSEAIKNHYAFSSIFVKMISIGEESGALRDTLQNLSTFYEEDIKTQVAKINSRVQPILMVAVYLIVSFLILAVMLPSFSIMNNIS